MTGTMTFESPNDWITKAGGHQSGSSFILPHKFLLVPMTVASEALLKFREANDLTERIRYGCTVVLMVRVADTAFFKSVADMIVAANKGSGLVVCGDCLRGHLWQNNMKELRQAANRRIIHKMEEGLPINNEDLEVVEAYYEEIFKHPLTGQIKWSGKEAISFCPTHAPSKKKNRMIELEKENRELKKKIKDLENRMEVKK
ncbi:hypothetical protein [Bdellovibrio bacteriovorus]|uniref:hypothetical protein n=1 Tax=Bdellovibrio bacteriovorus TaxID=959 RepID=UPI003AA809B2